MTILKKKKMALGDLLTSWFIYIKMGCSVAYYFIWRELYYFKRLSWERFVFCSYAD